MVSCHAMGAEPIDDALAAFLERRDEPCPVCRYNLRGIDRAQCPECGARLDLRVGSIDLRLGPWLLAVLGVAVPMGFTGVLGVIAAIGARQPALWTARDWLGLACAWALALVYGGMLLWTVRRRPRFLRRPRVEQWWRAAALTVFAALPLAVFVWLIVRYL